ncbi:hypothetical protein CQ12_37185 [Bradyrhizobium jicamae]|uniref:Uncharacterized protein n=1 Tax=Bradyrhizobium jicamae TaxID=280332 RepID=A0A0R3LCI1_9BRAD|nr:hypothetical protein CQ12_37185 [Bradyrhizobium jicamae]
MEVRAEMMVMAVPVAVAMSEMTMMVMAVTVAMTMAVTTGESLARDRQRCRGQRQSADSGRNDFRDASHGESPGRRVQRGDRSALLQP